MKDYLRMFRIKDKHENLPDVIETAWKSPSNIALIKYWGKKPGQLPANPSLSMTLSKAVTYSWVKGRRVEGGKGRGVEGLKGILSINNDAEHPFIPKVQKFYELMVKELPCLSDYVFEIKTENSFPHSTGIASSASGISAFTFCLLNIAASLSGAAINHEDFYRAVSFASRLGSGSACRSVYGGFTVWGKTGLLSETSDLEAVPINHLLHPDLMTLQDTILVVSSEPKGISSTLGHSLMDIHPYAKGRYKQAHDHLETLLTALQTGELDIIAEISEKEALSLHALLMTSGQDGLFLKPATLEIIQKIRKARKQGLPVFFTLDAGPNVHMLFPKEYAKQVEQFTRNELFQHCENNQVIFDHCGDGPVPIHISLL